ncbi:GAF domain-containing protein [Nocardioides sp. cx-169]|uniref:GAF domain-containing protein n=1 Tax=Nocardioides sp. cx-169 TaxID=2899080 RepID=UPI001E3D2FCE|nr:GAF domain-containing protein [Nocardioides sp. cx-169]MCD4535527.1 GAF domain-containing protein [Nocardioides sp. cx-169]
MEPIPETVQAIEQFGPFVIETEDLLVELLVKADEVRDVVPQCLGLSLASNEDEVTFTVVATARELAMLDAVQYVADGPCLRAVRDREILGFEREEVLDEQGWQLFAGASAAASVASTLTLPILEEEQVIGSVNLYAATPDAFHGHHEEVAGIFGAWAEGAVTNADMSFATRELAEAAPGLLREELDLTVASGMVASREGIDLDSARRRMQNAALRAGVTELQLARTIIEIHRSQGAG